MTEFQPANPDFEARTRASFDRQKIMHLIGAEMTDVAPGYTAIALPFREDLTQQHGFFHAGATSTIADSAGGYAAFTLFPADASVLTAEFKINLLAPASGTRVIAEGRVIKPGRTLTTCDIEVHAEQADGSRKLIAKGLQTLARLGHRSDIAEAG
ncbi:PaaI family thioesterase [Ferruginivarius sediminum]|uniref:Medium/long-chain acyl-CoA thioesterase YigI n=1 Tax=Ferruginivarius sediminum TaxID=2661937 RepID=A0A369TDJ6_9PROT|nr:PaaI family thioesterase [Ferruginivarius sediminum]RDD62455.1 PaaI family thioesterase [Ferruginivarius sediminum]